jgi:outer membrane protein assembly factor BamA
VKVFIHAPTPLIRILLVLTVGIGFSCSPTRRLGPEEYLLVKHELASDQGSGLAKAGAQDLVFPKPNRKVLGFWRLYLQLYNLPNPRKLDSLIALKQDRLARKNERIIEENRKKMAEGKHPRKLKKYKPTFGETLRKIGEPPVIWDTLSVSRTRQQLTAFAENRGFLRAMVRDSVVLNEKKRQARVTYSIFSGPAYDVNEYAYDIDDPSIAWFVKAHPPAWGKDSLFRFDLDQLEAERTRIAGILVDQGYYYFNKENIRFRADTAEGNQRIQLTMHIPNPDYYVQQGKDSLYVDHHYRFVLGHIRINADFDPARIEDPYTDSVKVEGVYVMKRGEVKYRPKTLARAVFLKTGQIFNSRDVERTRNALSELRNFRYINIHFRPRLSGQRLDTLDCYIDLSPSDRQSFTFEAQGTNTDGNLGVALGTSFQNKNIFGGAEIFEVRLTGGAEVQVIQGDSSQISQGTLPFNTLELGGQISLTTPKFIAPFKVSKYARPRSRFLLSLNYQNRPDYARTVSTGIFGYEWALPPPRIPGKTRDWNMFFQFNLVEISLVDISKTQAFENFLDTLNDQFVRNSFRQHYIQGISGSITLTNQQLNKPGNYYFFRVNAQSGGNALNLIHRIFTPDQASPDGSFNVFGIQYAQYARIETDFRYFYTPIPKHTLAMRALVGVGVPYGNTTVLPFEKSFFAGGANDIRAWLPRTLGPGSFNSAGGGRIDQVGDIKLLGQAEYRFVIYKFLEGATFADFGNIWLIRQDIDRPGGTFKFDQFLNEFALGAGVGLRLNLGFFVFRLDAAYPLRDPTKPNGEKWMFTYLKPLDDLRLNIGIGYPF